VRISWALFSNLKRWCQEWCPNLIKMGFEAAVLKASKMAFPETAISGCNFHFNQCLWRRTQEIGFVLQYKGNK
jgi:hypothetical protein